MFLAGEWWQAWLGMSITFLVAAIGVGGLGWWVLRGSAKNRAGETAEETASEHGSPQAEH